ncbi:MAG: hypothetical protein V3U80_06390 [Flavobacteriaceae bacterium]
MYQEELLHLLQKEIPQNASLIDAVAIALEISYDAAHRRVSLKSKFSLDETILLAKYYNLSIDRLFETTTSNFVAVEKTKNIGNEDDLILYLEESYASLAPLSKQKNINLLYSAKDIPLFYTVSDDILGRFKMYVWLKLLDKSYTAKSFEKFTPRIALVQAGNKLAALYNTISKSEIWDITTINSTLKQIHFYFEAGQLNAESALTLCDQLNKLITDITSKMIHDSNYQIYYNELHLMNNNVLVSTPSTQVLYVPFTLLSYYKTSDKLTCKEAGIFLEKQLNESKLLNTVGEKERNSFFNKIHTKIEALKQLINASNILDFE